MSSSLNTITELHLLSAEGKQLAASRDVKFIETSSGIQHNVDELLVGILKQVIFILESRCFNYSLTTIFIYFRPRARFAWRRLAKRSSLHQRWKIHEHTRRCTWPKRFFRRFALVNLTSPNRRVARICTFYKLVLIFDYGKRRSSLWLGKIESYYAQFS